MPDENQFPGSDWSAMSWLRNPTQKVWTLLAIVLIAAIFYRVAYDVPHNTCNDIWLQAGRRQNDPERADFIVQCVDSVKTSDYFDAAGWKAKAQNRR